MPPGVSRRTSQALREESNRTGSGSHDEAEPGGAARTALMARNIFALLLYLLLASPPLSASAQETLPAAVRADIDKAAIDVLANTGAPSASIAVVRDGQIAYVHAYGIAHHRACHRRHVRDALQHRVDQQAVHRDSDSAAGRREEAVARRQGRPVAAGSHARERVTLRQVLSMTSGYQDYWPQDYVMPGDAAADDRATDL